jgi:hypothetical protein
MNTTLYKMAQEVQGVFLVPPDFPGITAPLSDLILTLTDELRQIALGFHDSLHSVVRTLSIPYQYTYSQIHSLHWHRIHSAERIRSLKIENEAERDSAALAIARKKFDVYVHGEGHEVFIGDVLERLNELRNDCESLASARELMRQGVVLIWSALEVLVRDSFVFLLNRRPALAEQLLADQVNRKRFSVDKIDWQTLVTYGYDLSGNLGSFLISKADLTNVPAIRDVFGALFPLAEDLRKLLADRRLWHLCQKRNLIVHRRGLIDQQYLKSMGEDLPLGAELWITPDEIEELLEVALSIGTSVICEVKKSDKSTFGAAVHL